MSASKARHKKRSSGRNGEECRVKGLRQEEEAERKEIESKERNNAA
jgi:hypothetical protein